MRDLDAINPTILRPSKFASLSAGMLFLFVLISVPLAYGAAPNVPLAENALVLLMGGVLALASILAFLSLIFRWGWKAKYYGVFSLAVTGISFMAIVPFLAALLYGKSPYWARLSIALFYAISHVLWCRKFLMVYKKVYTDESLRNVIFEEEQDAVYYMRQGDNFLIQKYFKFSQMPRDRDFLLYMALAFMMIPFMGIARAFLGVPFIHIFLIVAMLPVSWMSIGLAFRAYLVFYFYPAQIKKVTGKEVYVDLASKHRSLNKQRAQKT